jgi:chromate transporter
MARRPVRAALSDPARDLAQATPDTPRRWLGGRPGEVLGVSLRLGLSSFGGPVAHLGYFERAFVRQRHWLSPQQYGNLVSLCQMLPGPTSSQVNFLVGLQRAGWPGALAAWLGFTLPSALLLYAAARLSTRVHGPLALALVHGLKLVAVAVVAQAVWVMARRSCTDGVTALLAAGAAVLLLLMGGAATQLAVLVAAAAGGALLCRAPQVSPAAPDAPARSVSAWFALALFALLLTALLVLSQRFPHSGFALAAVFYRAGALVFGGGHVVLPLLQASVVPPGWISNDAFLAGYGAAQAVPGPLFTFSAYLGTVMGPAPNGWVGAILCLIAMFLPAFLLVIGPLPFWDELRRRPRTRAALRGVNAAVVGLLLAALYNPVWTSGITSTGDFALGVAVFLLLFMWKTPPWLAVVFCAIGGEALSLLPFGH